jgi:hypothetical protein
MEYLVIIILKKQRKKLSEIHKGRVSLFKGRCHTKQAKIKIGLSSKERMK